MKYIAVSLCVLVLGCNNTTTDVFQQYASATTPIKLGEGTLSTDSIQWNNVFVTGTSELYYTKMTKAGSVLCKMEYDGTNFENLEVLDFLSGTPHTDVYVSREGNFMLFSSLMNEYEGDTIGDWNIWKSERINGIWQQPKTFFNTNKEGNQFYPWLTDSGNIYFAITPHGSSNSDLYISRYSKGVYQQPEALPSHINSKAMEGDAFVAPDERYMIFAGFDREQNSGKSDLYISFNIDGDWTTPVWLGEEINSVGYDGSPFVTSDEKYLIFTSSRGSTDDNTFFNHYIIPFDVEKYSQKDPALEN